MCRIATILGPGEVAGISKKHVHFECCTGTFAPFSRASFGTWWNTKCYDCNTHPLIRINLTDTSLNTLFHGIWRHSLSCMRKDNVWLFSRLWRINVQVFTLCWSVTDTSMNTWIMVIGQPHVEGHGNFKNQSTIISSHSMLLWFHGRSISVWVNYDFSRNLRPIPWKTDILFHFERIPLYQTTSLGWGRAMSIWSTFPNIIVPTSMPSAFWMEHFLKKPLQWPNLDASHSPNLNWKNQLKKSSFQTNTIQLHGRTFPSTSDLKAAWDWFGSISWDVNVIFLTFAVSLPIWLVSWKRFSASTLIFWARKIVCCSWAT